MLTELLGWSSSALLVLTIGRQVERQWRSGQSEGVSIWLFIGQIAASLGFTIYSLLVANWVFVATNAMLFVCAVLGLLVVRSHRRKAARRMRRDDAFRIPTESSFGIPNGG